jgi:8-oxo-dGTP diphosphatase
MVAMNNHQFSGKTYIKIGLISMHTKLPVAVHMFLFHENKILLLRRYNTGYSDGFYSLPAGHLNGNEPVSLAAVREAKEELGINIETNNVTFAGVFHRREHDERIDFFVRVNNWKEEPFNAEPGKSDDLRWADMNELPENLIPYIKKAIENLLNNKMFEEYGWGK